VRRAVDLVLKQELEELQGRGKVLRISPSAGGNLVGNHNPGTPPGQPSTQPPQPGPQPNAAQANDVSWRL
jgi:hypothetical protein